MDDRGLTALVTALETLPVPATYEEWQAAMDRSYATDAAAILAALPPDWCGHEIIRLQHEWANANGDAMREADEAHATITALRATLTEIRDTARSTYSQRCQWCDPLSLAQLILRPHRPDCPAAIAAVALGTP